MNEVNDLMFSSVSMHAGRNLTRPSDWWWFEMLQFCSLGGVTVSGSNQGRNLLSLIALLALSA